MFYWPIDDEIRLRLWERQDAFALAELVRAEAGHLGRWLPFATPAYQESDALTYIDRSRRDWAMYVGLELAVTRAPGWDVVGSVGLHTLDRVNRKGELGHWLSERQQGRGIMTRAAAAMVDTAFTIFDLNRLEIRAQPGNARSRAIPERLGFTEEALLRDDIRHPHGYVDHVVYGLLRKEWAGR